ncbi:hypothetical protein QFW96_11215 [Saccharopolyspora sp. TS4A08]|uniref:Uncharacterized protein n=1 Tax=Saccharopolyspora ipomoeae TaxID=3042027 RepID=A0ABT6PMM1_9PSEU|nr:hypothetical protein [Saccharopolyspora sp. TS4A08]MDI2029184.1 hypothetical protein [Saccharopolyspora sp. TS4A08]
MFRQRLLKLLPESTREDPSRLTHGLAATAVLVMAAIAPTAQALAAPNPEAPTPAVAPAAASPLLPSEQP